MTPCRRPKVRRSRRQHSRCRHPIPASPPSASSRSPRTTRVRAPLVSLGCGHRRATERSGLEPSSRRPAPSHQPSGFGSVRGLGFGVTPRALVSIDDFTSEAFDLYGRSHPSQRALSIRRDGPSTTEPTTVRSAQSSRAMFLTRGSPKPWDSLSPRNPSVEGTHYLHGVSERFRTNSSFPSPAPNQQFVAVFVRAPPSSESIHYTGGFDSDGCVGSAPSYNPGAAGT